MSSVSGDTDIEREVQNPVMCQSIYLHLQYNKLTRLTQLHSLVYPAEAIASTLVNTFSRMHATERWPGAGDTLQIVSGDLSSIDRECALFELGITDFACER